MRENGMEFGALSMIEKRRDLGPLQWPGKPLHIVLHKNLHSRALNRTRSFNRPVHATADGHVGTEDEFRISIFEFRFGRSHDDRSGRFVQKVFKLRISILVIKGDE